jgi:ADP-heptose:LPS heptosyltransferase
MLAGSGAVIANRRGYLRVASSAVEGVRFATAVYSNPFIDHEALLPLRFLEHLSDLKAGSPELELWLTDCDRHTARALITRDLRRGAPLIVLHPSGGRSALKQWPIGKFRELLRVLLAETDCDFLIIGGSDEHWIEREFAAEKGERVAFAFGRLTLRQLGAVMEQALLFVGGDSGPMHIAAAARIPVIGIFGPTSEVRFRPWGENCRVVSLHYPCSPDRLGTFLDRCATCRFGNPRCLTDLPVDTVLAEVRSMVADPQSGNHEIA